MCSSTPLKYKVNARHGCRKTKKPSMPRSSAAWPNLTVAKAYLARNCASVLKLTRRHGLRIVLDREVLHRCAGSRKRSSADLALPARGGRARGRQPHSRRTGRCLRGLGRRSRQGPSALDPSNLDVLFFSVYQYMIVYRRTKIVEIVAVLHGKRDVKRLLKNRL